jgi:hypothetical protein
MPVPCFSYPADGSAGSEGRDVTRPNLRDPRSMPFACFSYPADVRLGTGNRDAAQPGLRRMPNTACFRY